jgi:lactate dehydrogenase-like 2-hydroxyacid dehydrogenase
VNTARGDVVDEAALAAALADGVIAGAGLDVFEREPAVPEALAREVDFLVVITPGGAATRKLIDAKVLAALGKKGYLVNVARGSVVDEQALVQALRDGTIAGAGLDVFENEPTVPSELIALDNVVLTPHIGSATWQTRQAMSDLAFGNLEAHFAGKPLLSPVP